MMTALFLLSLVLAWPTMGLSVLAFVGFAVLRTYLTIRAQRFEANILRARAMVENGASFYPSWFHDADEMDTFLRVISGMARKNGILQSFINEVLRDSFQLEQLMFLAGAMERIGGSKTEQQVVVWERLVEMWGRLPDAVKDRARAQEARFAAQQSSAPPRRTVRRRPAGGTKDGVSRRLLRVAAWGWRLAATGCVLYILTAAAYLFVEEDPVDGVGLFFVGLGFSLAFTGLVWVAIYVTNGLKCDFEKLFVRVVLGDFSTYVWFVLGVLYLGGVGTAIWFDGSGRGAFEANFASGMGGALALLALGYPGSLLAPARYKHAGHVIGTVFVALASLIVVLNGLTVA
jgi:hypothetical protein